MAYIAYQQTNKDQIAANTSMQPRKRAREPQSVVSDKVYQRKKIKLEKTPSDTGSTCNQKYAAVTTSSTVSYVHKGSVNPEPTRRLCLDKNPSVSIQENITKHKVNNHTSLPKIQSNLTKEVLDRLPDTSFFKSLKVKINSDPNSPLAQAIIAQLGVLPRLKIPYTLLSNMLRTCNDLHHCGALLSKILVRCKNGRYTIEPKLQNILNKDIQLSALSSMLHKCGNGAVISFELLINKLISEKVLTKLKALKEQGIAPSHLSAMLIGSRIKAPDALSHLITLLTNDKYIDTLQKVTTALYSQSDVIHPNDEILVSKRASALLGDIGDLKKNKSVHDPSNDPKFKQFLTNCYHKNKHVDDRLLAVKKVLNDDPRVDLHGQDKVVAKKRSLKVLF
ncbi:hypothetical protein [Cardinium endosymbiont of Nabis limbatus]|uniref:hypothetical protein n=1 Tax=Cardinium endosymbiont of Nabis limbatus TaxID=3066217 RepID=UPI003AF39EF4